MHEDQLQEILKSKTQIIKECREDRGLSTCSECNVFVECEKRNEFVVSAYATMNKGENMDFDF